VAMMELLPGRAVSTQIAASSAASPSWGTGVVSSNALTEPTGEAALFDQAMLALGSNTVRAETR
jgi:hypothetical protein